MKEGAHIVLGPAARFYAPLPVLLGLTLLIVVAPGQGIGLIAGLAVLAAFIVYALVFGAGAARVAAPPAIMRTLLALGLAASAVGVASPQLGFASELIEAGLFLIGSAGGAFATLALFGRAPTMRDHHS